MPLSVHMQGREDFEQRTLSALAGAAVMAPFVALAHWLRLEGDVPLVLGMLGAALASARVGWRAWLGLLVALPVLLDLPNWLLLPLPVSRFLIGALAAAVVGGWTRAWKPRPAKLLAGVLGAGVLVPLGMYVRLVLDTRLFAGQLGPLSSAPGLAVVALFWSVGRLASHLEVHAHPVEARGASLSARLVGEPRELVSRTLTLHRECRAETARLPTGAGRRELESVLSTLALGVFQHAETYEQLEAQLKGARREDVDTQVRVLRSKAAATTDAVARRQLELAASSLGEELNQLETLGRKRERLLAQLHAQVAMLERARVSLVAVRGGDVSTKSDQAAQLARRLAELGQEDADSAPRVTG
jgi:hypothetical protein